MAEKDSKIDSENELMDPEDSNAGEDSVSSPGNEDSSETAKSIFWPEEPLYFVPSDDDEDESSKRRASQELHEESLRLLRMKIAVPDTPTLTSYRLDQLLSILQKHRLGLNKNSLFRYFRNCFNTNDTSLESLFEESLEKNGGSIVTKKVPGVGELYFMATNVIDLKEIMSHFAHKLLKLAICEGGKVSARSAVTKVLETYSVSFDVKDWGLDIASFVKIILSISPNGRLHLIPYDGEDQDSHPGEDYLFVQDSGNEEADATVRKHLKMREAASLPSHPIETFYAKYGEKVDNMGMFITEGLVLECDLFQINSIIDFYVILTEYWNQMESFQTILKNLYKGDSDVDHGSPPRPLPLKYLVPGTVATAFVEEDEEWHRVVILPHNVKRSKCKVRSTEFGMTTEVKTQDLRMLDREMFKEMPTLAIHCRLRLPELFNAQASQLFPCGSPQSSRSSVLLNEVVSKRLVYVTFRNFVPVHDATYTSCGEEYMWEVDIAIGKREGEFVKCEPGIVDLAEHLIQKFACESVFQHMFT